MLWVKIVIAPNSLALNLWMSFKLNTVSQELSDTDVVSLKDPT